MSNRAKRISILAVVVVVVAALVTAIAYYTAQNDPAQQTDQTGLYLDGKLVAEPGAVITIGSHEISYEEYRHYFMIVKYYYEYMMGMDDSFWADDPDGDKLYQMKASVEAELKNMYSWLDIAAEEGVALSDEELEEITNVMNEQKEEAGDEWNTRLAEMFFTSEENYLQVTQQQALAQKISSEYQDKLRSQHETEWNKEADAEFDRDMLAAKHILIMPDAEMEDQEEAMKLAKEKADGLYAEIVASEDPEATFNELMNEHSEDTGLATNPDGYTFKEGDMVDSFYKGTLALSEGEISEPIESDYGYHIIMRIPVLASEKEANRETYITSKLSELMTQKAEETEAALTVTPSDYYDRITFDSIK